jgi:hypothetical protein
MLGLRKVVVVESAVSGGVKRLEMMEAACFWDSKITAR